MPRITLPLNVAYESIIRPVCVGIARDVMRVCNMPADTPLILPGEYGQAPQPGTTLGSDVSGEVKFDSFRHVVCTADDTLRSESLRSQIVRQNEFPPILEDRALGISLRPVYVQSDVTLSFKYVCSTKQEAEKWLANFAAAWAEDRTAIAHEVKYDIPIQDGLLSLMFYLHGLREKTAGYGDTFVQWFKSMQKRQITTLSAMDGDPNKLMMSVPEKQAPVTGYFNFDQLPKEQKVDGNTTWEIEWTYKTMYNRCIKLYMVYPMMVHQSHISKKYFSSKPRFGIEEVQKEGAIGVMAFDYMDKHINEYTPPNDGLRVPYYDEWTPALRSQPSFSVAAITWMVGLDPANPQEILDLNTLPDFRWTPEMEAYLKANHSVLHLNGYAACFFTLYSGDVPVDPSLITIDENLVVRSTKPLSLRNSYHLRLSFPTRYSVFTQNALRTMQVHAMAVLQIFQSIVPNLDVEWAIRRLLDGKYLNSGYIEWFYRYLQDHSIGHRNQPGPIDTARPGDIVDESRQPGGRDPGDYSGSNWDSGNVDDSLPETGVNPFRQRRRGPKYVQFLAIIALHRKDDKVA